MNLAELDNDEILLNHIIVSMASAEVRQAEGKYWYLKIDVLPSSDCDLPMFLRCLVAGNIFAFISYNLLEQGVSVAGGQKPTLVRVKRGNISIG
jgi:hypothetical protein